MLLIYSLADICFPDYFTSCPDPDQKHPLAGMLEKLKWKPASHDLKLIIMSLSQSIILTLVMISTQA